MSRANRQAAQLGPPLRTCLLDSSGWEGAPGPFSTCCLPVSLALATVEGEKEGPVAQRGLAVSQWSRSQGCGGPSILVTMLQEVQALSEAVISQRSYRMRGCTEGPRASRALPLSSAAHVESPEAAYRPLLPYTHTLFRGRPCSGPEHHGAGDLRRGLLWGRPSFLFPGTLLLTLEFSGFFTSLRHQTQQQTQTLVSCG